MVAVSSQGYRALSNVLPFQAPPERRRDWTTFDDRCAALADGRITFEAFCLASEQDFGRLVRIAVRKRRAPASVGIDDLVALAKTHAWHYLFRHEARGGRVGFDPTRGTTAGAYVRFNVGKRLQKDLSRARGENQHRRDVTTSSPEVPAPEGFDPPDSDREVGFEARVDRRRGLLVLKDSHAETLREHFVMAAVIDANGDDARAACLLTSCAAYRFVAGASDGKAALRVIGKVLHDLNRRRAKAS